MQSVNQTCSKKNTLVNLLSYPLLLLFASWKTPMKYAKQTSITTSTTMYSPSITRWNSS